MIGFGMGLGASVELGSAWEQQLRRERRGLGGGSAVYGVDGWANDVVMSRCGDGEGGKGWALGAESTGSGLEVDSGAAGGCAIAIGSGGLGRAWCDLGTANRIGIDGVRGLNSLKMHLGTVDGDEMALNFGLID
ncbi:hypothetical protein M0R45_006564 [Rubus argutus]|uniref:Uncharacterized protein n=1 Tax=Rubus argutus TaxID=59490 RepID=A0AAW1YR86_RUBAR